MRLLSSNKASTPASPITVTIELGMATGVKIERAGAKAVSISLASFQNLQHYLERVQHLTIVSHHIHHCCNLPTLHLPNLITLQILPNNLEERLDLHTPTACHPSHHAGTCCPLLAALRPTRLILGSCSTGLSGQARGLWSSLTPFPPFIKELIILVGMFTGLRNEPTSSFFRNLPITLDKLTLVLASGDAAWTRLNKSKGDDFEHPLDEPETDREMVLEACVGRSRSITVVHEMMGYVDDPDSREARETLREELRELLVKKGWTKGEASRRAKGVEFQETRTFEKLEGWYNSVETASVGPAVQRFKRDFMAGETESDSGEEGSDSEW